MKALRISDAGLSVADVAVPRDHTEALVRVLKSGICATDIELVRGYKGFRGTIGHEFVGLVQKAPSDTALEGKRVVGEINVGCGSCRLCRSSDPRHCPDRTVLGIHRRDGCHAEYLTLPARNLIEVPDHISDEQAVFAEPLAAALAVTERVAIPSDVAVAVIGDGKLGTLCARALALNNADVTLIGKHCEKLKLAAKSAKNVVLLEDSASLGSFEVVVEASGSESGFATALRLVAPQGTIVLKSTFHGLASFDTTRIVVDEISVVGSRCGRMAPAVQVLADGLVRVDDLISEQFPLERGMEAMRRAGENGILKVLLNP